MQDARCTNLRYVWVPTGDRSKTKGLFHHGFRLNTLAAINLGGVVAHQSFHASVNKEVFLSWFEESLVRWFA